VKGVANRVDYRFKSYVVKEKQQYNSSWQKKKHISSTLCSGILSPKSISNFRIFLKGPHYNI
jgi:hypothetical protein